MKKFLSLVKFSHTIFALPFAMLGLFLGFFASGDFRPDWWLLLKVVLCMVFARNSAMAFNRYIDRHIDKENPRTAYREIPSGKINPESALIFVIVNCLLFIGTTYFINPLCFYLSPIALLVILGYSYTKRFTFLCHLILGLGLSLAPVGAYIAVTGNFALPPVLLGLGVLFWVAGFDIIYSLQDEIFDQENSLRSIPATLGSETALKIAAILHVLCIGFIFWAGYLSNDLIEKLFWLHWLGCILFAGLLAYQHRLVSPGKLNKINVAFFTTNGIASAIYCGLFIVDLVI